MSAALAEWYEDYGNAPHEALGRAARKLSQGGALYLGGGVGIEKQTGGTGQDTYSITRGAKAGGEKFGGPLSAVMRGFTLAGTSTAPDTPGGASKVTDPAAAARLRELTDNERSTRQDIARFEARLKAKTAAPTPFSPMRVDDDAWEARRLAELKSDLAKIAAERAALLSTGKVEEVEQARPGTNFTKIPPQNVAKLKGIIEHYKGMAHGFTTCVRDQVKHGLSEEHAKRRCAVVKDLGEGTTKWRKGGKGGKVKEGAVEDLLVAAESRIAAVDEVLGAGIAVALAEEVGDTGDPMLEELAEAVSRDLAMLAMAGRPLGVLFESFNATLHPRKRGGHGGGQFVKKLLAIGGTPGGHVVMGRDRHLAVVHHPKASGPETPHGRVSSAKRPTPRRTPDIPKHDLSGRPRKPLAPGADVAQTKRGERKLSEAELPKAVGSGAWSKRVDADVKALHAGDVVDTEQIHRAKLPNGKLGAYTPERIELHAQIAHLLFQGAGSHPEDAQAIFLAGGPASGKSSMLKSGRVTTPADAVDVNPDIVRTMLPEYDKLIAAGDKAASSKTHEEASHISKMVMNLALARKHHVVVDGVGNSGPGKFAGKIEATRDAGHRTSVYYATLPTPLAEKFAAKRAERTGRHVPIGYLRASHRDVTVRFGEVSKLDGVAVTVFDTRIDGKPKAIWQKPPKAAGRVVDRKLFSEFAGKAVETHDA